MSECTKCSGQGYVLVNHDKTVCDGCGGRGVISLILGKPVQESKAAEKKSKILEEIAELEDAVNEKEADKDDLDDEIDLLEMKIAELRRKIGV